MRLTPNDFQFGSRIDFSKTTAATGRLRIHPELTRAIWTEAEPEIAAPKQQDHIMHQAANDCHFQSANGSEASGGWRPTEQRATALIARRPETERSGTTEIACGSEELDPPFPFPPRASRGGVGSPHAGSTLRAKKRRLARIDAAGSPHKMAAAPLWIPCERGRAEIARVRNNRTFRRKEPMRIRRILLVLRVARRKNNEKPPRRLDLTWPSHGSDECDRRKQQAVKEKPNGHVHDQRRQ